LRKPETRQRFNESGFQTMGGPPAKLVDKIVQDRAKSATMIKDAKIGADDK
jgi:hypothetical protein